MLQYLKIFLFSAILIVFAVLKASNFSVSKAHLLALLEDPNLEKTIGANQQILGVWKYNDSYWVWGDIYRYEVQVSYSPEGQVQFTYRSGVLIIK